MPYQDLLIKRTSRFQSNLNGTNSSTRPYEDEIKKRLDKRKFSTYKMANANGLSGIPLINQIRYINFGYIEDSYTVLYGPTNPYPTPPIEP
jgi:hypothetical protein